MPRRRRWIPPLTAGAADYAAASMKAVEDAQAALDAELKAQEGNWLKSYTKAKELAAAAKTAGEKAAADAAAGKETAKNEATAAIGEVKTAADRRPGAARQGAEGQGHRGRHRGDEDRPDDRRARRSPRPRRRLADGKFLDAKAKAESAKTTANTVKTAVEAAMAAKKR